MPFSLPTARDGDVPAHVRLELTLRGEEELKGEAHPGLWEQRHVPGTGQAGHRVHKGRTGPHRAQALWMEGQGSAQAGCMPRGAQTETSCFQHGAGRSTTSCPLSYLHRGFAGTQHDADFAPCAPQSH